MDCAEEVRKVGKVRKMDCAEEVGKSEKSERRIVLKKSEKFER
jgi:hypothetical protein